ncbi:MAG: hypothetical protein SFV15_09395 [Polyangiaceae bacterium]|nr:hypothetical protein [Polyangiaceae bacterium]
MLRSLLVSFVLLGAAITSATSGAASAIPAAQRIVVLAHDGTTPELAQKVRAELSAMGFVVTELIRDVQPSPPELLAITRQAHAVATLLSTPEGVEIWVIEPQSELIQYHEQIPVAAGDAPEIPGLRAVEILRTQMTRWRAMELTKSRPSVPRDEKSQAPIPWSSKTWIGVGPAIGLSSGGVGLLPQVSASLAIEPAESFRVGAFGSTAVVPQELKVPAGKVDVRLSLAALFLEVPITRSLVGMSLGGGGGLLVVELDGKPEAWNSYEGRRETLITGVGFGQGSFFNHLSPSWCIRSDLRFGMSAKRVAIQSLAKTEASFGQPYFLGALALEAKLP